MKILGEIFLRLLYQNYTSLKQLKKNLIEHVKLITVFPLLYLLGTSEPNLWWHPSSNYTGPFGMNFLGVNILLPLFCSPIAFCLCFLFQSFSPTIVYISF